MGMMTTARGGPFTSIGEGGPLVRSVLSGAAGGAASALTGGKFANGFVTSAFAHMWNQEGDKTPGMGHNGGPPIDDEVAPRSSLQIPFAARILGRVVGGIFDFVLGATPANAPTTKDVGALNPDGRLVIPGGLKVGPYTLSKTVARQRFERPYVASQQLIDMIVNGTESMPDPKGHSYLRSYSMGGYHGKSFGSYNIVMDPITKTITHFQFESNR
jgi:hypothetical protein